LPHTRELPSAQSSPLQARGLSPERCRCEQTPGLPREALATRRTCCRHQACNSLWTLLLLLSRLQPLGTSKEQGPAACYRYRNLDGISKIRD
ncbi:hypothetical protein KIL84_016860, partial [Mauremys mutica]